MLTVQIDTSVFARHIGRYTTELGLAAADVIRDQTRLLLRQIIRFTPPDSLAQGRKAVARDITRAMKPIILDYFRNPKMREQVAELAEKDDATGLQTLLSNTNAWRQWRVEPFSEELHSRVRDSRGRVTRNQKVFIPEVATSKGSQIRSVNRGSLWNKYVLQQQRFVGRLKAAWGPAIIAVDGTLPGWVARHQNPRGWVKLHLTGSKPYLEFANQAKGVGPLAGPINRALRVRAKAMASDIRRRLRAVGKKAGFQTN